MKPMSTFFLKEKSIYFFAILGSILLSIWLDLRQSLVNPDGICYLISAEAIQTGISKAMQLCGQAHWPFYSILIYSIAKVTHLPFVGAAYILNGFFTCITVAAFILIIKELGGSFKTLWLAAFVILVAHDFNSVREYIIRDHGFWSFYVISIFLLLHYFRKPHWLTALAWSTSAMIATLFRIEGAIFLLALPCLSLVSFQYPLRRRIIFFFNLNLLTLLIGIFLLAWLFSHPNPQQMLSKLGRLSDIGIQIKDAVSLVIDRYQITKVALEQHVLTSDARSHSGLLLFLMLLIWYALSVISSLSIGYVLLILYVGCCKGVSFTTSAYRVLFSYIIINIAITSVFLFEHLFLSRRYLIALTLVGLVWVPFALQHLLSNWHEKFSRRMILVSGLFILISALGGILDFGSSKAFLRKAGDWLADNVPAKASFYTNDYQLIYYSKHFGNEVFKTHIIFRDIKTIAENRWQQYDYLAIRLRKKPEKDITLVLNEISLQPIHIFSNKQGDRVIIFRNSHL